MATKFARGKFTMRHPEKYVGNKVPTYRSSWELTFMNFCDNNKSVQKWASEAVQIPYRDPLTNRQTEIHGPGRSPICRLPVWRSRPT